MGPQDSLRFRQQGYEPVAGIEEPIATRNQSHGRSMLIAS